MCVLTLKRLPELMRKESGKYLIISFTGLKAGQTTMDIGTGIYFFVSDQGRSSPPEPLAPERDAYANGSTITDAFGKLLLSLERVVTTTRDGDAVHFSEGQIEKLIDSVLSTMDRKGRSVYHLMCSGQTLLFRKQDDDTFLPL
jgi:urease gamma subunit